MGLYIQSSVNSIPGKPTVKSQSAVHRLASEKENIPCNIQKKVQKPKDNYVKPSVPHSKAPNHAVAENKPPNVITKNSGESGIKPTSSKPGEIENKPNKETFIKPEAPETNNKNEQKQDS